MTGSMGRLALRLSAGACLGFTLWLSFGNLAVTDAGPRATRLGVLSP
jgi:hypothetical protein